MHVLYFYQQVVNFWLLTSALGAACRWLVCCCYSFMPNCFGVWWFVPIKGWTATLFLLTKDWRDVTVQCVVVLHPLW